MGKVKGKAYRKGVVEEGRVPKGVVVGERAQEGCGREERGEVGCLLLYHRTLNF